MTNTILFSGGELTAHCLELFKAAEMAVKVVPTDLDERQLIAALVDCDGYILAGVEKVSGTILREVPRLKVVAFMGVGYQSFIDAEQAAHLGVAVTNAPGAQMLMPSRSSRPR
jgi:glyoxylate reductase